MKRVFVLFLLLMLLSSVCSCSKGEIQFVRGTVTNNVYVSGTGEIRFAPGPEWIFLSEKETDEQNAENGSVSILDMSARDGGGKLYVDVIFIPTGTYVGSESMTVDEYIEKLIDAYNSEGKASLSKAGARTIGGSVYESVYGTVDAGDEEAEQYYYIRKTDGYFVSLNALVRMKAFTEEDILGLFE